MDDCIDHGHKAPRYSVGWLNGMKAGLHRVSYCKHHGLTLEDIKGYVIMHDCHNDRCINPLHLTKGTQSENIREAVKVGRKVCLTGDAHQNSKTTEEQRATIRKRRLEGEGCRALAREYNVSPSVITYITKGGR